MDRRSNWHPYRTNSSRPSPNRAEYAPTARGPLESTCSQVFIRQRSGRQILRHHGLDGHSNTALCPFASAAISPSVSYLFRRCTGRSACWAGCTGADKSRFCARLYARQESRVAASSLLMSRQLFAHSSILSFSKSLRLATSPSLDRTGTRVHRLGCSDPGKFAKRVQTSSQERAVTTAQLSLSSF